MKVLGLLLGIPWRKIGGWLIKAKFWLLVVLKPWGAIGIFGLAIIDSSSIPLPFMDALIVSFGAAEHSKTVLYCLMAAAGSAAIGSMVPYYLGRAGGELFLLKRINRERYERLRDRFEKQEFLAIMLPAMCPPPMPVKLFELAAGVFEMRPVSYFLAIATGKFVRFLIESILVIVYGPAILSYGAAHGASPPGRGAGRAWNCGGGDSDLCVAWGVRPAEGDCVAGGRGVG